MWHLTCAIGILTNDVIRTSSPGVTSELFARMIGCGLQEAASRFPDYGRYEIDIDNDSCMTVEEFLLSFAQAAKFEKDTNLFLSTVDPAIKCNRGLMHVRDRSLLLRDVLVLLDVDELVDVLLIFPGDAGEVFQGEDSGYRYFMYSNENSGHHEPHLHVVYKHDWSGSFSLRTGCMLVGDMRGRQKKHVKEKILANQDWLLVEWSKKLTGVENDLNVTLGSIQLKS